MTPGLAFFYGGMVRTRHILVMLKMSFASLAFGTVMWFAIGYTLAFGDDVGGYGLIGDLDHAFLRGIGMNTLSGSIPTFVFATFQMTFAIITVALISGSIADRATMRGWLVFVPLWLLIVYVPLAHWVFDRDGWIVKHLGALDFAGGLPVELNSGVAGLAVALVLRARRDFARDEPRPKQHPARRDRRRAPVVRLVRVQLRLRAARPGHGGGRAAQYPTRRGGRDDHVAARREVAVPAR